MLLTVALLLATQSPPGEDDPSELDEPGEAWLFADEGYRFRSAGDPFDGVDHDVRLLFDSGVRARGGQLALDVSGALFWDWNVGVDPSVDPRVDGAGSAPGLTSVHDARGPLDLLVDTLELRAGGDSPPWLTRASVGRFTVVEGLPITLDGAAVAVTPVRTSERAWTLFASAGRTVHFFEAADATIAGDALFDDWTASIGSDVTFADGLKLQVDYRALVDDRGSDDDGDSAIDTLAHSYGAGFWRRVDDVLLLHLFARGIDAEVSHVGGRLHLWRAPFGLDADAVQQVATLGEVFEAQDPFFAVLGVSHPHVRAHVDGYATHELVDIVTATLHLGAGTRQRLAGEDAPFNRNAARVYAILDADDVVVDGLFASVISSYDFATSSDEIAVLALGGSLGYAGELVRVRAGTSWDRVKYTYYRDVAELVDVRTVFVAGEWRPWRVLRIRGEYSLELADRVVHTVQVALAHDVEATW